MSTPLTDLLRHAPAAPEVPDPDATACRAPSTSLYFDVEGNVLACCHSHVTPLGNVAEEDLAAIWAGDRAEAMRAELAAGVLPPACRFCKWQAEDSGPSAMHARAFDRFELPSVPPGWPRQLEFSLSNRCNLQCVMCNGDLSSTIRARRERRTPLPSAYGDAFFEQLTPFLEHAEVLRFLGGEPFLVPEYHRIWDRLLALGAGPVCDITTNGTVWNERVERLLDAVPCSIALSLDGARRHTVESIRVGADYDEVIANARRFAERCRARGMSFALTYCLMRPNWHEFGEFVELADELGAEVFVNTVMWPPRLSLYHLPPEELATVVDGLRRAASGPGAAVVAREADRLEHWMRHREGGANGARPAPVTFFDVWPPLPERFRPAASGTALDVDALVDAVPDPLGRVDVIHLGPDGEVESPDAAPFLGASAGSYSALLRSLIGRFGDLELIADDQCSPDVVQRLLLFSRAGRQTRVVTRTHVDVDGGEVRGLTIAGAIVEEFPPGPPPRG